MRILGLHFACQFSPLGRIEDARLVRAHLAYNNSDQASQTHLSTHRNIPIPVDLVASLVHQMGGLEAPASWSADGKAEAR